MHAHRPPSCQTSGASDDAGGRCALLCGIYTVNHMMMRVLDRVVGPEGLTASRWLLLDALREADEPPTITELSDRLSLSPQNVSRMVATLEGAGLVTRDTSGPGRTVRVGLTPVGSARLDACRDAAERSAERILAGIDPDAMARTGDVLARIIDNIAALERELDGSHPLPSGAVSEEEA